MYRNIIEISQNRSHSSMKNVEGFDKDKVEYALLAGIMKSAANSNFPEIVEESRWAIENLFIDMYRNNNHKYHGEITQMEEKFEREYRCILDSKVVEEVAA